MRAARRERHVSHRPGGQHDRARAWLEHVHDLFHGDDRARRREHRFLLNPGDAPVLHVAKPVGALGVNHRHVRTKRGDRRQYLPGERAGDVGDARGVGRQVGATVATQDRERQARCPRQVPVRHASVAVLLDFERHGPAVLDRVPEPVQRPDARVPRPGENQLARAARPDQLVVDHVWRHPDQREVAPMLPDHLVPGGMRYQVREALYRDGVAVTDVRGDRLGQRYDLRHPASASYRLPKRYR
jgi:hypothetical protein